MAMTNTRRPLHKDLLLAGAIFCAGLVMSGVALGELAALKHQQVAQATPPLQSTPGAESKPSAPDNSVTTGTRPSDTPPEPARPDADAQKAGATPALPPAPAEKTAAPIPAK